MADLPPRFSAVEARERVLHGGSTEGGLAVFLAQVGPGLAVAQPHHLEVFRARDEALISFLVYPISRAEADYYDDLVGDAKALAEMINPDLASSPNPGLSPALTVHAIEGSNAIADASGGVTFPTVGLLNSTASAGPVMDAFVFRRGAVLAFILYQYDTVSSPTDVHDSFVGLGQTLDDRVKRAMADIPDLAAPGLVVAKAEDPVQTRLASLTQSMLNWPSNYGNLEESGMGNSMLFALSAFRGRIRSYTALGTEGNGDGLDAEMAQLMVIYPLDADEQQTLDWVFEEPQRLAEYLLGSLYRSAGGEEPDSYDDLYLPLSSLEGVKLGDSIGGLTLQGFLDVVMSRRGAVLAVAAVYHTEHAAPAVDVVKLAQTLDAGVAAALQGPLPADFRATRTPVPATPTQTALPTPSLSQRSLPAGIDHVCAQAFSPDSRFLALSSGCYTVTLWDTDTLEQVATVVEDWHTTRLAFSVDGRLLAAAGGDGILIWDTVQRTQVAEISAKLSAIGPTMLFSPDGKLLAWAQEDGFIVLWDVATRQLAAAQLPGPNSSAFSLAFSPGGQLLAAGGSDGLIRLWQLAPRLQALDPLPTDTSLMTVLVFSPDSQWLAAGGFNGFIGLWQLAPRLVALDPLPVDGDMVKFLAFTPDSGGLVAYASNTDDFSSSDIAVWDLDQSPPRSDTVDAQDLIFDADISSDGHLLAWYDMSGVNLWDLKGRQIVQALPDANGFVVFSPDGRLLATGGPYGSITLWDTAKID